MSLKGASELNKIIDTICQKAALEGWSQAETNAAVRDMVDKLYSKKWPLEQNQDSDGDSQSPPIEADTAAQLSSLQEKNQKLYTQSFSLRDEIDRLNAQNLKLRKFPYICGALVALCIGLSIFSIVYGNTRYGAGYAQGYAQGHTAGYEAGGADMKSMYSKPDYSKATTVYITSSGSRYHEKGCSYLSDSAFPVSLKDATSEGYTPCSRCNPPEIQDYTLPYDPPKRGGVTITRREN